MAPPTILDSGLPGNSHSGANQNRRPGIPAYLEQVVHASSADPDSPGAYRYDPESADTEPHHATLPDSDPRSPRYEPPHLRHRPGDTWIIDRNRPHDPLDPGAFGAPGWHPDPRTGRHRRNELPDPPRDEIPKRSSPDRSPGPTAGVDGRSSRPWKDRNHQNRPSPSADCERADRPRTDSGGSGGEPPQPPRSRSRFWAEDDDANSFEFNRLREDAWVRFLSESHELHQAHLMQAPSGNRWRRCWERLLVFLFHLLRLHPARIGAGNDHVGAEPLAPQADSGSTSVQVEWRRANPDARAAQAGRAIGLAQVKSFAALASTPTQPVLRSNPLSPYLAQWERHFDARLAFREAVVL